VPHLNPDPVGDHQDAVFDIQKHFAIRHTAHTAAIEGAANLIKKIVPIDGHRGDNFVP
jgi:hypothetical protein